MGGFPEKGTELKKNTFETYFRKIGDYILSKDFIRNHKKLNQLEQKYGKCRSLGQKIYDGAEIAFNGLFRYGGLYLMGDAILNADSYYLGASLVKGAGGLIFTLYSIGESRKQTKDIELIENLEKSLGNLQSIKTDIPSSEKILVKRAPGKGPGKLGGAHASGRVHGSGGN